jgi:hypothetical protein
MDRSTALTGTFLANAVLAVLAAMFAWVERSPVFLLPALLSVVAILVGESDTGDAD